MKRRNFFGTIFLVVASLFVPRRAESSTLQLAGRDYIDEFAGPSGNDGPRGPAGPLGASRHHLNDLYFTDAREIKHHVKIL
jgi:hypothetical protein